MPASIPLQQKTPFALDGRPLEESSSAHAGALSVSRAFRALRLPGLIEANLSLKSRGYTEGQFIESLVLVHAMGGDCYDDLALLENDSCLNRGLGYQPPKADAVRKFINRFHDPLLVEQERPEREVQKSFIPRESAPLEGLGQVLAGCVGQIARSYAKAGQQQRIATIDQDATIIESHKKTALHHYEGGRGYQPMVAVWSELDLVVADEFRDGNVPARQAPLNCAKAAFAAVPHDVNERYFRGDSACHENELIAWLNAPERAAEAGGRIGFAISAVLSGELAAALKSVPEETGKTFATESDGTLRQWAEIDFVPGQKSEHKDSKPLRYVGLRLTRAQREFFADGSQYHFHAIITNRHENGGRLLQWHREKAGTVEHTHEEVKNGLGGGQLPGWRFGANAAWFRIALIAYNITSAIRGLALEGDLRNAKLKKLRLYVFNLAGRMNRFQCKLKLRFCASRDAIARIERIWAVFELPTQATAFH